MKTASLLVFPVVAAILGAGCVMPGTFTQKSQDIYWTTLEPTPVNPTEQLVAVGPFHLYYYDSLAIINFDKHYNGDDTPWIDRTDDFRQKIADTMLGYDPASITLADVAYGRANFLRKRLGDDFVSKEKGRNGEELFLLAGANVESLNKYSYIRTAMYRKVFSEYKESAKGDLSIQVVSDMYVATSGDLSPVYDKTVYLFGLRDSGEKPVPKATYTVIVDKLVRKIAIEGTERSVPGGTAIDVETPRGRFTVYRASYVDDTSWRSTWRDRQDVWYVGQALVKLLNTIPAERFPGQQEGEK